MAPLIILLFFLSGAASDQHVVTVNPGENVTLTCNAGNASIHVVEWTRDGLESKNVFFYRDRPITIHQHPSFKGRVELVDRKMENGDASLVLKNVSREDRGTYECRVKTAGSSHTKRAFIDGEPINTIRLEVTDQPLQRARPGENAILTCDTADASIDVVEWTRDDLESKYVFLVIDGHPEPNDQHPSFKGRVELMDRKMENGDASLVLKNVRREDRGTYECRVKTAGSSRTKRAIDGEPINTIRLEVTDSQKGDPMPDDPGNDKPGNGDFPRGYVGLGAAGGGVL